ncbi:YceI family protein [Deltaproteobacteria bacterium TL4]
MRQIRKMFTGFMAGMIFFCGSGIALASTYKLDAIHSSVGFGVRHLMISNVNGRFNKFEGTLEIDEAKKELISVEAQIAVDSINTEDVKRDEHLKSADFFDATKYPTITFKSTDIKRTGNNYEVTGNLTLHGVTKKIVLKGQMIGLIDAGMFGGKKAGFSATTTINREDFGLSWSKNMDSGGLVIGNSVEIKLEIEANAS